MSVDPINLLQNQPAISQQSVFVDRGLNLHYRHDLPGELEAPQGLEHHLITIFLTENQRQVTCFDSHGEYDGSMAQGEFYLYPAQVSGFTSWSAIDETLHLIIKPNLLRTIALETECLNPDKIELLPVLKTRDAQIEKIAQLLLGEIQDNSFGGKLYLESLTNVLAIHLLRNYSAFKPVWRQYDKGLAPYKLRQTIDYIQAHLDTDLSLEVMAKQIRMSRYYFATQFKQAVGIPPYRYVNQQRIKKAKQLLRQKKHPISLAEIALECGFASQSHLNKLFRQYVGTTPKKYRDKL